MTLGRGRILFVAAVLLVAFGVVVVHFANVMLVDRDEWLVRSARNRWAFRDVPVQRGAILDRNGVPLAVDDPAWSLWLDPLRFLRSHPVGLAYLIHARLGLPYSIEPEAALREALALPMRVFDDPKLDPARTKSARELAQALLRTLVPRTLPGGETAALQAAFRAARRTDRELREVVAPSLRASAAEAYQRVLDRMDALRAKLRSVGGKDPADVAARLATQGETAQLPQRSLVKRMGFETVIAILRERELWPGLVCQPTVERRRALPGRDGLLSLDAILGRAQPYQGSEEDDEAEADPAARATSKTLATLPDLAPEEEEDDPDALVDFAGQQARSALLAYYKRSGRFGSSGIEAACDERLAGTPGLRWIEKNARAEERRLYASFDVAPGSDVRLTIDVRLQLVLEDVLDAFAHEKMRECGLVLLDAASGEVLAIGGRPLVDAEGTPRWTSPALAWSGPGDLGSVAKPFVLLEHLDALGHGRPALPATEFVPCTQFWPPGSKPQRNRRTIQCDRSHLEGGIPPAEALARSCNYWYFQAATRLGPSGVARAFQRFGLAQDEEHPEVRQWEIPGLRPGLGFPRPQRNPHPLEYQAIGYGLEASPLRVARAYAALATGRLPNLSLVLGTPLSHVELGFPREHLAVVHDGMQRCLQAGGTAHRAATLARRGGFAKTGTAEISGNGDNNAWLAGFLPGANGRTLAFAAVIYFVPNKTHGGDVAVDFVEAFLKGIERDPALAADWLGAGGGK